MPSILLSINSDNERVEGNISDFTMKITPSIQLDPNYDYKIALGNCIIPHSWYNISQLKGNNIFRYSLDGGLEYSEFFIPNGYYDIERFNIFLSQEIGPDNIVFSLGKLSQKINITLAANYVVQFIGNLSKFFGFNQDQIVSTNTTAPNKGLIQKVRSVHIHSNLVDRSFSYMNGKKSDLLYTANPIFVLPFSLVNLVEERYFTRIRQNEISRIRILFTDQDGDALEFDSQDHVSLTLLINDRI